MKKSTKVWLFVAGIVFFIGLIALIVSLALGWDMVKSTSKDLETQTISIQQDFDRISLECDTQDVYLLPSADGECRVVFVTEEYYDNTAEVENGCLQVKSIDHSSFIDHVGISFGEASSITVYLPKLEYDALVINADTSDISIPKEFSFGTVDISLTTGDTLTHVNYLKEGFAKFPQSQGLLVGLINYYVTSGKDSDQLFSP